MTDTTHPADLVSIIITCYNYGRFLAQAIDSALAQTYPNVEIIVVDDGSTDNTREVAEQYGAHIKYIYQSNAGVAHARNHGLAESKGHFINFLDADDWLLPEKIAVQMAIFEAKPELDVIICGRYEADEAGNILTETIPFWGLKALHHLLNNKSFSQHSALIRRCVLEAVGGFCEEKISESWTEDTDLWLRLAAAGYRFYAVPQALCTWRHHQTTTSRSQMLKPSFVGFHKMIDRVAALNSPLITSRQLHQFRVLADIAFFSRFVACGDLAMAQEIFTRLINTEPGLFITVGSIREMFARYPNDKFPPTDSPGLQALENRWIALFNSFGSTLSQSVYQQLMARVWLVLSDCAYGVKNTRISRQYFMRAFRYSYLAVFERDCLATLLRVVLGPTIGSVLGKISHLFMKGYQNENPFVDA